MVVDCSGDLLKSGANMICHQVNCMGVMGSGIAKQIRAAYPGIFRPYKAKCDNIRLGVGGLGDVQFYGESDALVANLFAQYGYGRSGIHTDYGALRTCMTKVRDAARIYAGEDMEYRVAFPSHIGCGLAGGDWHIVRQIIEEIFGDEDYICEIWALQSDGGENT